MTLLLILIVVGVQHFLNVLSLPWRLNWGALYYKWCEQKVTCVTGGHGLLGLAILIVPMVLIIAVIYSVMLHLLGRVGYAIFTLFLLWYCLDARDLKKQPYPCIGPVNTLGQVYQNLFGPLFWFVVLGPMWLAFYYLVSYFSQYFNDHPSSESKDLQVYAQRVLAVLNWIPLRLFTFSFALVGQFTVVTKVWVSALFSGLDVHLNLIAQCGQIIVKTTEDAVDLVNRVLIMWLVVIALVTIGLILG